MGAKPRKAEMSPELALKVFLLLSPAGFGYIYTLLETINVKPGFCSSSPWFLFVWVRAVHRKGIDEAAGSSALDLNREQVPGPVRFPSWCRVPHPYFW